ncbi:MAG: YwiC-like family protein [Acidobacteria bacterium]|nr:YwiC-like family protein [Acidobacteriota bacterium]
MSLRTKLKLPKEHGAWAMLYVPMAVAMLVAETVNWSVLWLGLSATAFFIARESTTVWWKTTRNGTPSDTAFRYMAGYLLLSAAFGFPLVVLSKLYWLIPFAVFGVLLLAINTVQTADKEDRSLFGELLAILGMTATAPTTLYVARGEWDSSALWLWEINILFFASSVFHVKWLLASTTTRRASERDQAKQLGLLYHILLGVCLITGMLTHNFPFWLCIAFAPVILRALWAIAHPVQRVNLKRVGIQEIVYSLIFVVALAFSGI